MAEMTTDQLLLRLRCMMEARDLSTADEWSRTFGEDFALTFGELDLRLSGVHDTMPNAWRFARAPEPFVPAQR